MSHSNAVHVGLMWLQWHGCEFIKGVALDIVFGPGNPRVLPKPLPLVRVRVRLDG